MELAKHSPPTQASPVGQQDWSRPPQAGGVAGGGVSGGGVSGGGVAAGGVSAGGSSTGGVSAGGSSAGGSSGGGVSGGGVAGGRVVVTGKLQGVPRLFAPEEKEPHSATPQKPDAGQGAPCRCGCMRLKLLHRQHPPPAPAGQPQCGRADSNTGTAWVTGSMGSRKHRIQRAENRNRRRDNDHITPHRHTSASPRHNACM